MERLHVAQCIQAYRTLAKHLRRSQEHYRDPGTLVAILRRYRSRGALTEEQVRDFLSAGHAGLGRARQRGRLRPEQP